MSQDGKFNDMKGLFAELWPGVSDPGCDIVSPGSESSSCLNVPHCEASKLVDHIVWIGYTSVCDPQDTRPGEEQVDEVQISDGMSVPHLINGHPTSQCHQFTIVEIGVMDGRIAESAATPVKHHRIFGTAIAATTCDCRLSQSPDTQGILASSFFATKPDRGRACSHLDLRNLTLFPFRWLRCNQKGRLSTCMDGKGLLGTGGTDTVIR